MRSDVILTDLPDKVDTYIEEQLLSQDDIPAQVLAYHQAQRMPMINMAPNQGKLLNLLIRMSGAKRILEIGTLGGYSTIWMALALPAEGKIVTLDFDENYLEVARASFAMAKVSDKIEIRHGSARQSLLDLIAEKEQNKQAPFDLIFIDADKENNPLYLRLCLQVSRSGTVIIADNVVRDGKLITASDKAPNIRGIRSYYQALQENPLLDSTAIQTMGSKGWDGLAISIVI